ncbi:hypothetical protein ACFPAF_04265 [Hymenobacter endophyticus]|uniref:RiboL-PSP-HEPN domain-containing protein n=1 Tax=Hymenobacter endophyticus TaxID=3076335 RepID=A0ABU3TE23_9BACT|nr:hypothetical protein [Hymenobacter endophyticus]MDU0369599.1 hypothetical protein [Hymenobacter endophyticus]
MSKLDIFKQALLEITQVASSNPELAEDLTDQLLNAMDEHFIAESRFSVIEEAFTSINNRLCVLSAQHQKQAKDFYRTTLPQVENDFLCECYAKYRQALSNGEYPLACKSLFQQIETMTNFLIQKKNVIDDLKRRNKLSFYFIEQKNGYYTVALLNKIRMVSDYYQNEFNRLVTPYRNLRDSIDKSLFDKCRELRNGDSHGLSFDESELINRDLSDFATNHESYLKIPLRVIEYLRDIITSTYPV